MGHRGRPLRQRDRNQRGEISQWIWHCDFCDSGPLITKFIFFMFLTFIPQIYICEVSPLQRRGLYCAMGPLGIRSRNAALSKRLN